MKVRPAYELMPHLFAKRGTKTKGKPTDVIGETPCPSCERKRQWRIVSTRALKGDDSYRRNAICLGCGYKASFIESVVDGEPRIMLKPSDNELELLKELDNLRAKLNDANVYRAAYTEVMDAIAPGETIHPNDFVDRVTETMAVSDTATAGETWAAVRDILGEALAPEESCTPENLAVAIDQRTRSLEAIITQQTAEAREAFNDRTRLQRVIAEAGARKVGDKGYAWPFYLPDGKVEYLPVHEWLRRRQEAADASVTDDLTDADLTDAVDDASEALGVTVPHDTDGKVAAPARSALAAAVDEASEPPKKTPKSKAKKTPKKRAKTSGRTRAKKTPAKGSK